MTCNQNISPREREVLNLIAYELTTKEIASRLCISTHTTDSHRKNLMQKLCVKNTAELVRVGFQSGLLSLSPILLLVFLFGFQSLVFATHTTWTGVASDHDWFNAVNWDSGVPMPGDSASISSDSVIINNTTTFELLRLRDGARLVITPTGILELNNGMKGIECVNSTLYNHGDIVITKPQLNGIELIGTSLMDNFPGSRVDVRESLGAGAFLISALSTINLRSNSLFVSRQCAGNSTNEGQIKNRGILQIRVSQGQGMVNSGYISNRGHLRIDSTILEGIVNEPFGKIDNYDTIRVTRPVDHAILNEDSLINHSTGFIDIKESKLANVVSGIFNTGVVINEGICQIRQVGFGITNNNNFFNRSIVSIDSFTNIGLANRGLFSNSNDASLKIFDNIFTLGAIINHGTGLLLNEGSIDLDVNGSYGILNHDYIYNLDTIQITGNLESGIINNDSLDNFSTGFIHIHDMGSDNESGLENNGRLTNEGKIQVSNVGKIGILNNDQFVNSSIIEIEVLDSIGIINVDSLFLETTSEISISNISGLGTPKFVHNEHLITNLGKLTLSGIDASSGVGIGIFGMSNSFWFNSNTSAITMSDVCGNCEHLLIERDGEFIVFGLLSLK